MIERISVAKAKEQNGTVICRTRYGNVMASRGSVIPLFVKQLGMGQKITVTVPEMTRFMMTLEDAVDLVLFAFENGESGDLLVQKAPAATIWTRCATPLAHCWARCSPAATTSGPRRCAAWAMGWGRSSI